MSEIAVRAERLVLGYGPKIAVHASDLEIPAGTTTAIIGPNGSGKSTLLNAVAGVIEPRSGSLTLPGVRGRRRVSYVMQSIAFPTGTPITVAEVVGMGRYASLGWLRWMGLEDRRRVREAMERLEITDLATRHLGELSGGQRQRVYVAQGIAQDHDILLLDEPLTGLDMVSSTTIDRIVHAEREDGQTIILTTHDLDEARAADFVVLMDRGVLAAGPPEQVLTKRNLERAYHLGGLHEPGEFLDDPAHPPHEQH